MYKFARNLSLIVASVLPLSAFGGLPSEDSDSAAAIDFSRDIRPILSNKCFKCHGPDDESRQAELRLDSSAGATAVKDGRSAIVAGRPAESQLIARINSSDPDQKMPPVDSGLTLSPREVQLLTNWIQAGAQYDKHWSFRSIVRPPVPMTESAWPVNAIDQFVLSSLNTHSVAPSPEAARHTLIRRVHLDVLGLPPTVNEVDAYLADTADGAYARMVDRALASPHFGERWGRHWLDQARYADTNGYTIDSERSLWPYRDWVIRAINDDMPFDQFTVEQLAGDLLPNPTTDQLVATGFHRNTLINEEGGTDAEQFRNEAVVDRVNTTGAVWLGLTIGCAQCHTHKYDPISHREYYQLFAFFNQCKDVNTAPPMIPVPDRHQRQQSELLEQQIASATAIVAEYDKLRTTADPSAPSAAQAPINWQIVDVDKATSIAGALFTKLDDRSLLVSADVGATEKYTMAFRSPVARITGLKLEALTDPSLPMNGPGRALNGNFVLAEIQLRTASSTDIASAADSATQSAKWLYASADHSQRDYNVLDAIDGRTETGWAINDGSGKMNVNRTAVFIASDFEVAPQSAAEPATIIVELHFGPKPPAYNLGRFRISVTDASHTQLQLPDEKRAALLATQKQLEDQRRQLNAAIPTTLIMADTEQPRETHILVRGDFLRKGNAVVPGVPHEFPALSGQSHAADPAVEVPKPASRLELAQWLMRRDNPLTARVTVNRMWARYFGQGLVDTENDFGLQGTPPTHPELLDWLAAEFMEHGWSAKHIHRLILNSATYRQSSDHRPDLEIIDPLNKWLARQTRLRVDAEVVRDIGLAVSGLLNPEVGGPSIYPPQPDGVYAFTQRKAVWPVSEGADRFRRGLYIFYMRSAPYPMLTTFDTPRFNTTCTMRIRSNTPLQSLTMANDEAMLEMARALGKRLQTAGSSDSERIDAAFRICFSRSPSPAEHLRLAEFLQLLRSDFTSAPEEARQVLTPPGLTPPDKSPETKPAVEVRVSPDTTTDSDAAIESAAWILLARTLLNLDELIVRE